jgi:hypothetical protein
MGTPSPNPTISAITCTSSPKPWGQGAQAAPADIILGPSRPLTAVPYSDLTPAEQSQRDQENTAAVEQAQNSIDVDFDHGAYSSSSSHAGYETDSVRTVSTSLAPSVRDYTFENGRRYHKFREGQYNFPNDDSEQDREDMKHNMMVNLCQTLHFAPIGRDPGNILDMGTGTGIWAIESESAIPLAG